MYILFIFMVVYMFYRNLLAQDTLHTDRERERARARRRAFSYKHRTIIQNTKC